LNKAGSRPCLFLKWRWRCSSGHQAQHRAAVDRLERGRRGYERCAHWHVSCCGWPPQPDRPAGTDRLRPLQMQSSGGALSRWRQRPRSRC
jgi:hypothetical protein